MVFEQFVIFAICSYIAPLHLMLMQFKTEGPPLTYSVASLASSPGSLGSEWLCFVQEPGWVKQWHVDSGKTSDMLVSLVV